MTYFDNFPKKSITEVAAILSETGHDTVTEHILFSGGQFQLAQPIEEITALSTYKFVIACALASLGNPSLADRICSNPECFVKSTAGGNVLRELANRLLNTSD